MPSIRHLPALLLLAFVSACSGPPEQVPSTSASAAGTPASRVDWPEMAAFWERASALPGIDTGPANAQKRMVVYFDPHCPACARQWAVLHPYMDEVRIHWVPVAYIDASSARVAAAMLSAPDPAAALATNEQAFDFAAGKGGYLPEREPPKSAIEQVQRNTRSAMRAGDLSGTPTLGFELMRGQRYYRMVGLLEGEAAEVAVADLGDTWDPWAKRSGQ